MNWLDLILLALLLLAAYAGWCLRGLILVAVGFSVTFGPWLSLKAAPHLAPILEPLVHGMVRPEALAFWIVLAASTAGLLLLFHGLAGTLEAVKLAWVDRGTGALAALVLAFCLGAFLFLDVVARQPGPNTDQLMRKSWFCTQAFPRSPRLGKPFENFLESLFASGDAGKMAGTESKAPAKAPAKHHPGRHKL
jgi:uncharacterized membrane protein required for colicin V production